MNGRIRLAMLALSMASVAAANSAKAAASCPGAYLRPSASRLARDASATLCLINQVRHAHHLKSLRTNATLRTIASGQSHDMRRGRYFGDDSLSGLTPMQRVETSAYGRGAKRISVGQNIAWGEGGDSTPAAIVASWLGSGPHREILLSQTFQEVGVGIAPGTPCPSARGASAIYTLDLAARRAT